MQKISQKNILQCHIFRKLNQKNFIKAYMYLE
jgi:hypothetical protein